MVTIEIVNDILRLKGEDFDKCLGYNASKEVLHDPRYILQALNFNKKRFCSRVPKRVFGAFTKIHYRRR